MKLDRRILITGISGFIGSKLKEVFIERGYEVWGISRQKSDDAHIVQGDLSSFESTKQAFAKLPDCSIVIHAAALAHSATKKVGQDYYKINITLTNNLTKYLFGKQIQFIYLSSISVYGLEGSRSSVTVGDEKKPATNYGMSKLKCEEIIQSSDIHSIAILRPAPVFDDNHLVDVKKRVYFPKQSIFKLVIKPSPKFSLCHINTLTTFILNLVDDEKKSPLKIMNVADPAPYNQNELARKFSGVEISIYSFLFYPVFRFFKIFDSGLGYAINCNLGKLFFDNIYE